ncbi:MAG: Nif3-like dinuclear metal center hexameric protein [Ignavibacteria bacterium]|nr:Nif3-like dinuclear metal center hexameric protein [Ignavibacteria bacterium]
MAGHFFRYPRTMTVQEIQRIVEQWAPPSIAWDRDNVGLQVGNASETVQGVLVALDATASVVSEARRRKCNLIITHHPLLFRAPRAITTGDSTGRIIQELISGKVSLVAAHTNLDFTQGGTSFALAEALGLERVEFLHRPYRTQKKIVTFVPAGHVEAVSSAMAGAGAGRIGNYDHCSFQTMGTGTFRGNELARPAVGKHQRLERVSEVRLEMVVDESGLPGVLSALRRTHPYEEVAFDVYPTENVDPAYGMGIIGVLRRPVPLRRFLSQVKSALGVPSVRFTGNAARQIRHVAACGGSGSDLLGEAVRQGAEAFVTADVKYHTFHDADGSIALIDAGHYETEYPVVHAIVKRLGNELRELHRKIPVRAASSSTNPIQYV